MSILKDALQMSYNFETKEAQVVFPKGTSVSIPELTSYFEDASEGYVQLISVLNGETTFQLARSRDGRWVIIN
jgi:hypothetical protein